MSNSELDCLFEPLEMSNLKLKNRFYMAPMGTGFDMEKMTDYLTARSKGGVALITTGETSVHPSGRAGLKNEMLIENDNHIKPLSIMAKRVKKDGAKIVIQLNHAGRYSPGYVVGGQSVAPSAVMSGYTGETPRELSTQEVDDMVSAFAAAAVRAREAGFDGVEFMGSSGYLISEFLSPLTNKRQDKYGGDVMKRAKFIISIVKKARELTGPDFNICVKFDADDGMKGGVTLAESCIFAPAIVKAGADRLHVWAGWHESTRPMLPMSVPHGAFTYLAAEIKKKVTVPVSAVGRINDPYIAAEVLKKGDADLIGLARALLADPDFVNKTAQGRVSEIRKCTACCHCFDSILAGVRDSENAELCCALNPELGRESENLIKKTNRPRHVVVVGSGPAGMEAARVAAIRGHRVTVYESGSKPGGLVNISSIPPFKDDLRVITDYYTSQVKVNHIDLKLNSQFTSDKIQSINPDTIVLATGAKIALPNIPGIAENEVLTALEVLENKKDTGSKVVIIGGGMVGLETAEYLADSGKDVAVVEMKRLASDVGPTARWGLISRLRKKVKIYNSTRVLRIFKDSVLVLDRDNNESEIYADSIVIAAGMVSNRDLCNEIAIKGIEYYLVGSCKQPGLIDDAIKDGFEIGCIV